MMINQLAYASRPWSFAGQQTTLTEQKNWGKCCFSPRISCLAFSSPLPRQTTKRRYSSGLGAAKSRTWLIQCVCWVRLICFFVSRVTCCPNEQLSNWDCAMLLICLHWVGSCFGVGGHFAFKQSVCVINFSLCVTAQPCEIKLVWS